MQQVSIHKYICITNRVHVSLSPYIYICVCAYLCIHIYKHVHIRIYRMFICMYLTYKYIYIHTLLKCSICTCMSVYACGMCMRM